MRGLTVLHTCFLAGNGWEMVNSSRSSNDKKLNELVFLQGMVEKWLIQVEEIMIKSLMKVTEEALVAYTQMPRDVWVQEWPGQVPDLKPPFITSEILCNCKNTCNNCLLVSIYLWWCTTIDWLLDSYYNWSIPLYFRLSFLWAVFSGQNKSLKLFKSKMASRCVFAFFLHLFGIGTVWLCNHCLFHGTFLALFLRY